MWGGGEKVVSLQDGDMEGPDRQFKKRNKKTQAKITYSET